MAAKFPNDELVACVAREVAMRKTCYPKWDKKPLDELSPARKKEIDMMEAIGEQVAALPELLARYQRQKEVLADILPQPYTYDHPTEGKFVFVYLRQIEAPLRAVRRGLNEWEFLDYDPALHATYSADVVAFSYPPSNPFE